MLKCKFFYFLSGPSGWCVKDYGACTHREFWEKNYPENFDKECRRGEYSETQEISLENIQRKYDRYLELSGGIPPKFLVLGDDEYDQFHNLLRAKNISNDDIIEYFKGMQVVQLRHSLMF